MKLLDLFSGIGGFSLAAHWASIETMQFVEKDENCQKILSKNFPSVPIHNDIKTYTGAKHSADIICGGFPCQPYSLAGDRKGADDERALWGEMLRIISEVKPAYILGENVLGLLSQNRGLEIKKIRADLENQNYQVEIVVLPAYAVGFPHSRNRVWIVAHSNSERLQRGCETQQPILAGAQSTKLFSQSVCEWKEENYLPKACFFGDDDGLPTKLDKARVKALGNSIIPALAYKFFKFFKWHSTQL
jgi:DNA (cytosine-5)-methyltransferase 1